MGCSYEMACWDCGVREEVGHGSHITWLAANSLEQFDAMALERPEYATRIKNVRIRDFLQRHNGHRCEAVSEYIYDAAEYGDECKDALDKHVALRLVEPPEGAEL